MYKSRASKEPADVGGTYVGGSLRVGNFSEQVWGDSDERDHLLEVTSGEASHGAGEVVGHDGQGELGGVGHELRGREVRESGALEFGDPLLDHRVPTVVGLDLRDVAGAVGDEGVVVPGGEQRQLSARGGLGGGRAGRRRRTRA